jgi:hypothetical protein
MYNQINHHVTIYENHPVTDSATDSTTARELLPTTAPLENARLADGNSRSRWIGA